MGAYNEQIVFAPSEDQRWLAGVMMQPTEGSRRPVGVVCIHGAAVGFYVPTYVHLGRELARRGYLFVSGNTRGHDVAAIDAPWPFRLGPQDLPNIRLGGSGWERYDEVPYDVAGWINFLTAQGVEQVVLVGHSFGVFRVSYYQAERQDPRVVGLVVASGGDRVYPPDPARVEQAQRLVAEGRGDALMPVAEGLPIFFAMKSAANVVHWDRVVGPFAADGHMPWIASIRTPMLATLGTAELVSDLRALVEEMQGRAVQTPRFDIQVIEGADHAYTGREREWADVVARWIEVQLAMRATTRGRWWSRRQKPQ
jgi:pimeloyl-ACP methyl ester carboxylesterase